MAVHRNYFPQRPLTDFVDVFWLYESTEMPHTKERRLPDGSIELVINLREDRIPVYDRQNTDQFQTFRGSLICGPHSEFSVIDTATQASIIGVHFKPGGAFPFFKLPASELRDTYVSLDMLWGAEANDLREQLLAAETPEAKFCQGVRQTLSCPCRLGRHLLLR